MAASASLLKNSWAEFKTLLSSRWETYVWTVVLRFALGAVLLGAAYLLLAPTVQMLLANPDALLKGTFDFHPIFSQLGVIGLLFLIVSLIGALIQFGFLRVVLNPKAKQTPAVIISSGAQRYWWTLFVTIALAILLVLAIGLGMFAFILPGIYLAVMMSFSPFAVVLDGKGPIESIKQSWAMVRGRWWSVFGTFLFWGLVSFVAMMVVNGVIGVFFHSAIDERGVMQMQVAISEAARLGQIDQVMALAPQLISKIFNPKAFMLFGWQMLAQVVFAIIPVYGYLAVYKVVSKMPKAKMRK